MASEPVEGGWLSRWLRQYIRLRWMAVAAVVAGLLVARYVLNLDLPLFPSLVIVAVIVFCNTIFALWQGRRLAEKREAFGAARLDRRFALVQVISDLLALTVLLHFVGGIETPFFLFYLFHVGFGSIMLSRRDAYMVAGLTVGLFLLLAGAEYAGWISHVHLEGLAPVGLYRNATYLVVLTVGFAATLFGLTVGATIIVEQLRRQYEREAQARERELVEAGQRLEELDRMRAFFLALASHDLKTPLAVVANYLQAILDGFVGEVNEKQRVWMERANVRVLELIRLINDFLDVSQLAPERIAEEMEFVLLEDVVRRSSEEMRPKAEEKEVTLEIRIPEGLPSVYVAPRRLQQVVTNLLDNGVKFSPRGGLVVLEVHQYENVVQVDVVDQGPGISALYLSHIFDDYFRVQRKEFIPGAGLGLSTARKIVEAHGGEIWVTSPCFGDGKGSRFSFSLPLSPQERSDRE
jgi:signal transduction histidine kinase